MFPIIVEEKSQFVREGERYIEICCLAPIANDFNEKIELRFQPECRFGSVDQAAPIWSLSKGSSGSHDTRHAELVHEGYALAIRIMKGDNSVISKPELCEAFRTFINTKRETDKAVKELERQHRKEAQEKYNQQKLEERRYTANQQGTNGEGRIAVEIVGKWQVRCVENGLFITNANGSSKKFATMAKAIAFIKQEA